MKDAVVTTDDWFDKLETSYQTIIDFFNRDNDLSAADLENFKNTPKRVVKALMEMNHTKTEIKQILDEVIQTKFPMEDRKSVSGMVTQGPIYISSTCPHHLLPVLYSLYVSYIPKPEEGVLGLSKLVRIAEALAGRPVLQEQLAEDIATVLHAPERDENHHNPVGWPTIKSEGSAVILTGKHLCMACRGVKSNALTSTATLRGIYYEEEMEEKFYKAVEVLTNTRL